MVLLYRCAFIGYTTPMVQQEISEEKTKILYVVESFSTGVYAIVRDIACNLDPNRFEILILHSLRNDSPKQYHEDFAQPNITLLFVPMGSYREYVKAIRTIGKTIETYCPDCIHLHSSKAGFLGRIAVDKSICSHIVYSPHGFSFLRTDVGVLKRWIFFQLEYWIDKYVPSKIIAVSDGEKEQAQKITKNSVTINNFIDTAAIQPNKSEPGFDFVTTGRIAPQKNPVLFNRIANAMPHHSFLWVGDGPLRSALNAPNITVTGYIPRSEAIAHVTHAKVYLQTSLWEGMPVSLLEAMAAEKAVVASNVIGNKDLIIHDDTGILCDPEKPDQFIDILTDLMSSESKRLELGQAARAYVVKFHDIHQAIHSYEKIYASVRGR